MCVLHNLSYILSVLIHRPSDSVHLDHVCVINVCVCVCVCVCDKSLFITYTCIYIYNYC